MKVQSAERGQSSLTALLLVGGLSTRMGCDKATLEFQDQPLWLHQLQLLRGLPTKDLWISARTVPDWAPSDTQVLLDAPPSLGPLSGIAVALERMQTTHLLVLAVDLPKMTAPHLRKLIAKAEPSCGVIPVTKEHLEPLAAVYPKGASRFAQEALSAKRLAMHSFAESLVREGLLVKYELSQKEAALYLNLNTPADLTS